MATTFESPSRARQERPDLLSRWLARAVSVNWVTVVYIAIFIVAVFTRFAGLGDRVMSHDESLHTQFSYYLFKDGNFRHDPLMHGPILFHVTAFFYFLFGDNDYVARLYPAILGVLMTGNHAKASTQGAGPLAEVRRIASRYLEQLLGLNPKLLTLGPAGLAMRSR